MGENLEGQIVEPLGLQHEGVETEGEDEVNCPLCVAMSMSGHKYMGGVLSADSNFPAVTLAFPLEIFEQIRQSGEGHQILTGFGKPMCVGLPLMEQMEVVYSELHFVTAEEAKHQNLNNLIKEYYDSISKIKAEESGLVLPNKGPRIQLAR